MQEEQEGHEVILLATYYNNVNSWSAQYRLSLCAGFWYEHCRYVKGCAQSLNLYSDKSWLLITLQVNHLTSQFHKSELLTEKRNSGLTVAFSRAVFALTDESWFGFATRFAWLKQVLRHSRPIRSRCKTKITQASKWRWRLLTLLIGFFFKVKPIANLLSLPSGWLKVFKLIYTW